MSRDGLSFGSSYRTLGIIGDPLSKLATHTIIKKSLDILLSVRKPVPYERYDHKEAVCTLSQGLLGGEVLPVAR